MPLKVAFIGDRLSGKSTIAERIANKYGIICINPRNIIKEAVELNKEPPIIEDPKKKKDPKKTE